MIFRHAPDMYKQFPTLRVGVVHVDGIRPDVDVSARLQPCFDRATERLTGTTEGEFPEIQAWRRAFSRMGLKPTQYRCAAESLLRRFRKEGALPSLHPLIDLANAISLAYAIPVAAIDTTQVSGNLTVRPATGTEHYLAFDGNLQSPPAGEIIFADDAGNAHARRWTHRQSGLSAIRDSTASVLIVAEALHDQAEADIRRLVDELATDLATTWESKPTTAILHPDAPAFTT